MSVDYDELGRVTLETYQSNEATWFSGGGFITREFLYSYDWVHGTFERLGPDGETTYMETDRAGRVTYVSRGAMSAKYYYYPTGQLRLVRLGNGAFTRYEYDAAQRLLSIQHYAADTSNLLRMDYAYTTRDLIDTITETDDGGAVSVVSFTYDTRSRLLTETRNGEDAYDLTYTYDQGGNRLTKTAVNDEPPLVTETVYHYDLEDPATYQTKNNRLMYDEVFEDGQPVERVDYTYEVGDDPAAGNVVTTVRKPTDDPLYYGTGFTYNKSGELWIVTQKTWELAGEEVVNEQTTDITEFRGMGRRRYMSRQRDVNTLLPIPETAVWHDYAGETIYGDYTIDVFGEPIDTTAHMPGLAQTDQLTGETAYYHADLIGTTRLLSDDLSAIGLAQVYTAFGEPVSATGPLATRYGYAGASGYQTHSGLPLLHVGHRYYAPATGRFPERDPLGTTGGLNTYAYVSSSPTAMVDPQGLYNHGGLEMHWLHKQLQGMGYTPVEASEAMAAGAAFEAKAAGVWALGFATGGALYHLGAGGGWLWLGYRNGTFMFRLGRALPWLYGVPSARILPWRHIDPFWRIPIWILRPCNVQAVRASAGRNCLTTMLKQVWLGWKLW